MNQTITFDEVKRPAKKRVRCAVCQKPVQRQRTFSQTLNPFNKKKNGQVKTRRDISDELTQEAEKWKTEKELCNKCK